VLLYVVLLILFIFSFVIRFVFDTHLTDCLTLCCFVTFVCCSYLYFVCSWYTINCTV